MAQGEGAAPAAEAAERKLLGDWLQRLGFGEAERFVARALADEAFHNRLIAVGNEPEALAAAARAAGFALEAAQLEAYRDWRLARDLPAPAQAARAAALKRRAAGASAASAAPATPPAEPASRRPRTLPCPPPVPLERAPILAGEIVLLRGSTAAAALCRRVRGLLEASFAPAELALLHRHFDPPALKAAVAAAVEAVKSDHGLYDLIGALIGELGWPAERVVFEWPGVRVLRPDSAGGNGFYRGNATGRLGAHRDSWYGSPLHQLNFWGPLLPLPPGGGLRLYPELFDRPVENTSRGYDVWANMLGLALPPAARGPLDLPEPVELALAPGELACYAGAQLHASGPNISRHCRISLEFRLLFEGDEALAPPNVDYHGLGEIYDGWHRLVPCGPLRR